MANEKEKKVKHEITTIPISEYKYDPRYDADNGSFAEQRELDKKAKESLLNRLFAEDSPTPPTSKGE